MSSTIEKTFVHPLVDRPTKRPLKNDCRMGASGALHSAWGHYARMMSRKRLVVWFKYHDDPDVWVAFETFEPWTKEEKYTDWDGEKWTQTVDTGGYNPAHWCDDDERRRGLSVASVKKMIMDWEHYDPDCMVAMKIELEE